MKCPNCGKKVSQLELDENRGVCGLCYEYLSSHGYYDLQEAEG